MANSPENDDKAGTGAAADEGQLIAERRAKLAALRVAGIAYPNDFVPGDRARDLHALHDASSPDELTARTTPASIAGRMMLKRVMGKASFATIQDATGRIQLYVTADDLGALHYASFRHWDLGDIVAARGTLFKTRTGELTVRVTELRLLAKSLRPLPDKFHGINDPELKYRQRYVDLIVDDDVRHRFQTRAGVIQSLRNQLSTTGFLEVETPMLQPIPGGAAARPFVTHHHALDQDMYLRIAPELYLKRLIVGGYERVFEINRNFRNEGVSPRHNPEFTMLEFYAAYTDYTWLMEYTETLIRQAATDACGTSKLTYQGREIDLGLPFERLSMADAIAQNLPRATPENLTDVQFLKSALKACHIETSGPVLSSAGPGGLLVALFEAVAEAKLWQPTFIIDFPLEVSPLARASDTRPGITERFELYIAGREIANAFSELNDPEDQAERFKLQAAAKEAGDLEAMYYDADYVRALEYGMPPAGGCGVGIDRLVMLLTDAPNIRDVILFPHLRRES